MSCNQSLLGQGGEAILKPWENRSAATEEPPGKAARMNPVRGRKTFHCQHPPANGLHLPPLSSEASPLMTQKCACSFCTCFVFDSFSHQVCSYFLCFLPCGWGPTSGSAQQAEPKRQSAPRILLPFSGGSQGSLSWFACNVRGQSTPLQSWG